MQQAQHSSEQQQGLLQDLLTPINQSAAWTTFPDADPELLASGVWDTSFNEEEDDDDGDSVLLPSSSSFLNLISTSIQPSYIYELPNLDSFTPVNASYSYEYDDKPRYPSMVEQEDAGHDEKIQEKQQVVASDDQIPAVFSMGFSGEKKSKSKKVEGQPSKNLMAERRRRKRLNDRLSMLRSIVPRISKMDRTSILGDTIEYMKDLIQKIHNLTEKDVASDSNSLNLMGGFMGLQMNEMQARNPPKFEVERRTSDTRIEICCSTKPGLLLSTVNTLEALGLDIQQCVISSFSDFSLQASCTEALENRAMTSSEEIKQILFRNAGYGGRFL